MKKKQHKILDFRACRNCPGNPEDCFLPQCITADGIERTVLVYNRILPGPAFHVPKFEWLYNIRVMNIKFFHLILKF